MYTAYSRRAPQLGFWTELVAVGAEIGSSLLDGDDSVPADQYYPAVKAGTLFCSGPFSIDRVAAALERNPDLVPRVDAILAQDRAWGSDMYGPLTTRQKASAVVNWAHGGRDCIRQAGETSFGGTIAEILRIDESRRSKLEQAADTAGQAVTEAAATVQETVATTSPIVLAGLGLAAVLFLQRARG